MADGSGTRDVSDSHKGAPVIWEAIIKVNTSDAPGRRARDIAEGIGYACALLHDEYGWTPAAIEDVLDQVAGAIYDDEADRG